MSKKEKKNFGWLAAELVILIKSKQDLYNFESICTAFPDSERFWSYDILSKNLEKIWNFVASSFHKWKIPHPETFLNQNKLGHLVT